MKKILICLLSIVLLVGVSIRIWYVNKDVDTPPIHTFNMGEEVEIEKDVFLDDFENMDGYTVTVNNAEIIPYEAFLLKYQYEENAEFPLFEEDDQLFPEMIYDLHLTIKNTNITEDPNEHNGINFLNYYLTGTDFLLHISDQFYAIANPDLESGVSDGFRLRPDSEMDFQLPFYFAPSSKIEPIQVEAIMNDQVYLGVSLYPNVKRILVE